MPASQPSGGHSPAARRTALGLDSLEALGGSAGTSGACGTRYRCRSITQADSSGPQNVRSVPAKGSQVVWENPALLGAPDDSARLTFLREAWAALGARLNERLVYKSPIVLPEYSQLT